VLRVFAAIRFIGIRGLGRTVLYALQKSRIERRFRRAAPAGDPVSPGALQEVEAQPGGARCRFERMELDLQFLAPDLLRVTWGPAALPIPYALLKTEWSSPPVRLARSEQGWELTSDALHVEVGPAGDLRVRDAAGRLLREELPPQRSGDEFVHRARLRSGEHLYGLGNRTRFLNLRGRAYEMWNRDPGAGTHPGNDPIYLCIPVYLGVHAEGSYLMFYENPHRATFRFGDPAEAIFSGGALRYYLIAGPPPRALERYSELTGRPGLPPRWALGYHQSRWSYASDREVRDVVEGFQTRGLPLSAIHLDIDYMDRFRVFTVDRRRFPGLAGLVRELEERGVALVTILDPGVKHDRGYAVYESGDEENLFCTLPDGRPVRAPVWPGWCAFPDFTNPRTRAWWGEQYRPLLEAGVAGVWHDMNEPATFAGWGDPTLPQPARHSMEGRGGDHREAHNLYGLLMNRAGYEALRRQRPQHRPFVLTRSGWAGIQRYAWNWTGDVEGSWRGLRQTVATVLGLGLSGVPYTGPDIGGFSGSPSGELYVRWFQLAAFLPFFRTHSAKGTPRREPWSFGQRTLAIVREFLNLRYRLLPYLYTLAWEASTTGHPLVRPLYWLQDQDQELWDVQDAFLLGNALLVAPVLQPGAHSRDVRLPAGTWYEFHDDTMHRGPGRVVLEAPLERIPLLVRGGTVLPLEETLAGSREKRLVLHLYADEEGGGLLYSDAGEGYGPGRLDRFRLRRDGESLIFTWGHEGGYPFPYRDVTFCVHGMVVRRALVGGAEVSGEGNCFPARHPADARFDP